MAMPEILTIRFYRQQFGDVDVADVFSVPGHDPLELARTRLLAEFRSPRHRNGQQPNTATVCGEDNRTVAHFHVQPTPNGGHEVIEVRDAHRT